MSKYFRRVVISYAFTFILNLIASLVIRSALRSSATYLATFFIPRIVVSYLLPIALIPTVLILTICRLVLFFLQKQDNQLSAYIYTGGILVLFITELIRLAMNLIASSIVGVSIVKIIISTTMTILALIVDFFFLKLMAKSIEEEKIKEQ